ncbi:S-adenosyl-L-methionine-dependent methyltransferase-1 [Coleophoma crateriformis]|uniref:S-adenosyl-L-methionine-dependent methyltransferase-1 n=1 Tax=Coleophoma crateriformis TaxID=565419 RepID=A0A3D8R7D3_9HELO|nr:S-adenosyl-L-methionine-dependent methyltransferase-1 [Coleophoma crateriformis]
MVGFSKTTPILEEQVEGLATQASQREHTPPRSSRQSLQSISTALTSKESYIDADSTSATDDDAFYSDRGTTTSVTSNVWKFDKENGRTYHGYRSGVYYYPNDPKESERLDFQYNVIQEALSNKLHFAPINNPRTVLDIGTGTGIWAIEMGDAYPDALIEATDLSPIQPEVVPDNVQFIIDDASEEDWAVPENHYDFIHTRIMMGSFEDFGQIIRRGFKYTKPGGWMESQDVMHPPFCDDGTMPADWPFRQWSKDIEDAARDAGRPLRTADKLKKWFIEAGFVDVHERAVKLPINTWPRDKSVKILGHWWAENLLSGLQGFSLALLSRVYNWSKDEIEVYLVNVRKAIVDRKVHAYHKFYTVWGRKPLPHEVVTPKAGAPGALATTSSGKEPPRPVPDPDFKCAEPFVPDPQLSDAPTDLPPLPPPSTAEEEFVRD